jgi:hypothetical protein
MKLELKYVHTAAVTLKNDNILNPKINRHGECTLIRIRKNLQLTQKKLKIIS